MTKRCRKLSHSQTKEKCFSVIQIKEGLWRKLNNLKTLFSRKEELHFSKDAKEDPFVS